MSQLNLYSSVGMLRRIGDTRRRQLEKLGISTVYDLLSHFPRSYEDRTRVIPICDMQVGVPACFRATVVSYPNSAHIRKGLDITKVTVADPSAKLHLTFFNQPYLKNQLRYGEDYIFYGTLQEDFGNHLQNPQFDSVENFGRSTGRILPIYPLTAGISNKIMNDCISQALNECLEELPDVLPSDVQKKYGLCSAQYAYRNIHAPASFEALEQARRRLIFEEFFIFSAGLAVLKSGREVVKVAPWDVSAEAYCAALPYKLTGAQTRAVEQIRQDFAAGVPMNRLVQGDVGSGKTAVAAAAAYMAHAAGKQTALMAPTEILAEQHMASLGRQLGALGMEVVLLTGAMSAAEKKWTKERIRSGQADLVIGTHALLTEDVEFDDLALVITDEQHRFGVRQRAALAKKARQPHMLFLSATPIPRTLGLILYGDMDVSVMDELPPGRQPVDTFLVSENLRQRVNGFIRKQADAGHQVYVVCPAVEENEETELKSAEAWAQTLRETLPGLRVGLVHGKMKAADKDAVMRAFSGGELDLLVATTVIEVGVDVPNATLMIIEDADRFGLSQLHQLRGRVGRGKDKSYCVLVSGTRNPEAVARMKALCATNDGFQIAEQDLAMRGPGDFFGSRQHGLPQFKVADLELDLKTLQQAQEASQVLSSDRVLHDPAFAPLLQRIRTLFRNDSESFN